MNIQRNVLLACSGFYSNFFLSIYLEHALGIDTCRTFYTRAYGIFFYELILGISGDCGLRLHSFYITSGLL